jgi:hypothetical protein
MPSLIIGYTAVKVNTHVLAATVYPKIVCCVTVAVAVSVSAQAFASPSSVAVALPSTNVSVVLPILAVPAELSSDAAMPEVIVSLNHL